MRFLVTLAVTTTMACGGQVLSANDAGSDGATPSPTGTATSTPTSSPTGTPTDPPPVPGAQPPPRPNTATSGKTQWFAVRKFQLGLTHRVTGAPDPQAWRQYGYDLDRRTTTREMSKTSQGQCKRRAGSGTTVLGDGDLGRDNNFGQHAMAVVKSLKADAEDAINYDLDHFATLLLELHNVGGPDNGSVPGALYVGLGKGSCGGGWTIDQRSTESASTTVAKVRFPKGYMSGGLWVSGDLGAEKFVLPMPWVKRLLQIPLASGIITFRPFSPESGTIAGATNTDELQTAFKPWLIGYGICPGNATYDQVVDTLTQSADVVLGAPNLQDPNVECNAVSLGLGFIAEPTSAPGCSAFGDDGPNAGCF